MYGDQVVCREAVDRDEHSDQTRTWSLCSASSRNLEVGTLNSVWQRKRKFMKNIRVTLMRYVVLALAIVPAAMGNVVTDWNAIASTTIVKNGGKAPGGAAVWFTYESLAVYDAVNAITGQYRPFYYYGTASRNASIDAAVAATAHRVLVNYFPSQQTDLDAQFAASLSTISPGDAGARNAGVAVGEEAAAAIIAARRNDGLEASVP